MGFLLILIIASACGYYYYYYEYENKFTIKNNDYVFITKKRGNDVVLPLEATAILNGEDAGDYIIFNSSNETCKVHFDKMKQNNDIVYKFSGDSFGNLYDKTDCQEPIFGEEGKIQWAKFKPKVKTKTKSKSK